MRTSKYDKNPSYQSSFNFGRPWLDLRREDQPESPSLRLRERSFATRPVPSERASFSRLQLKYAFAQEMLLKHRPPR